MPLKQLFLCCDIFQSGAINFRSGAVACECRAARDVQERPTAGSHALRGRASHTSLAQCFPVIVRALVTTKRTWLDALREAAGDVR